MAPNPRLTAQQRLTAIAITILLIATFSIVIVFAGHGAAPIGLLLAGGYPSIWAFHLILGWVGLLLALASLFFTHMELHRGFAASGLGFMVGSLVLFTMASELWVLTLLTSIPFLVFSLVRIGQMWRI